MAHEIGGEPASERRARWHGMGWHAGGACANPDWPPTAPGLTRVKRRAVRHNGAVLTYAPTDLTKAVNCAGYIDSSIKFHSKQRASRLTKVATRPADHVSFAVSCSTSSLQSSNQSSQPFFWRLRSMDLFGNEHCTHARAFADMLEHACKSFAGCCLCALCLLYTLFGIDPTGGLAQ